MYMYVCKHTNHAISAPKIVIAINRINKGSLSVEIITCHCTDLSNQLCFQYCVLSVNLFYISHHMYTNYNRENMSGPKVFFVVFF